MALRKDQSDDIALPTFTPFGVTEFVPQKTGVFVCQVHYTADPAKRTADWKRRAMVGKPQRTWDKEMEINWAIAEGQPVFPDYEKSRHQAGQLLIPSPDAPLVVGLDFGFSPAAAISQRSPLGQIQILRCLQPENFTIYKFAALLLANLYTREQVRAYLPDDHLALLPVPQTFDTLFPKKLWEGQTPLSAQAGAMLSIRVVGDPAGRNRSSNDGRSPFRILKDDFRIRVRASTNNWETRRDTLTNLLVTGAEVEPGVPAFTISPDPSTEVLREGLGGLYAYPENAAQVEEDKAPKGKYSHIADAVEYTVMDYYPSGSSKAVAEMIASHARPVSEQGADVPPETRTYGTVIEEEGETASASSAQDGKKQKDKKPLLTFDKASRRVTFNQPWNPFLQSLSEHFVEQTLREHAQDNN